MEIAKYHRKASLLASAGNVPFRSSDSWGELGQLGNVLTQVGLASEQQRIKAEEYDQLTSAENQVDKEFDELFNSLDPNDTESWDEIVDKKSYDEITKSVKNSRAAARWGPRLEAKKLRHKRYVSSYRRTVDARNYQRNYYLQFNASLERAASKGSVEEFNEYETGTIESMFGLRLKEGAVEITPENLESVEDYDNPMFKSLELRKSEAMAWHTRAKEDNDEYRKEAFMDTQLKAALAMPEGLEYLNSLNPDDYDFDLDDDDIADLKRNYRVEKNAIDSQAKKELEVAQEVIRNDFIAKIQKGELTFEEVMASNLQTKGELGKEWFREAINTQAEDILKGEEIITDQRVKTDLEKMALDVSTGAVTHDELSTAAAKARYDDKTIDDAAFDDVMTIANREHKTYQANAIGDAITYARFQLLDEDEVLYQLAAEADLEKGETIAKKIVSLGRRQSENLDQYKRALNEWFESEKAAGREPDDDDIYIKSRTMLIYYRDRDIFKSYKGLDISKLEKLDRELTEGMQKTTKKPTREEFVNRVGLLKSRGREDEAKEYYDKWVGEISWRL